ncbi:hypothetical protein LPJ66_007659 [Kickxella alabastrina]|uniref:Uncharacterized protein n=1 Tax=Kickxella alabastrina TaxID=61397 RepID=A0ACC1IGK7_9FUNG|nr:hypothetical protein LPJ66_007659 [Kickxella alabastrina]
MSEPSSQVGPGAAWPSEPPARIDTSSQSQHEPQQPANARSTETRTATATATASPSPPRSSSIGSGSIDEDYPAHALFMRQCLPESAWEADDAATGCRQCGRSFSLFLRRHHCRRCGLLFCVSCSSKRAALASPLGLAQGGYYGASQPDDDTPLAQLQQQQRFGPSGCWALRDHRTCDACAQAVGELPDPANPELVPVDYAAEDAAENAYNIFGDQAAQAGGHQRSQSGSGVSGLRRRGRGSSSVRICPVCDRDWATVWNGMRRVPGEGWQEAQERHIRACIEDTSAEMQGARPVSPARRSRSVQPHRMAMDGQRSSGFLGFFNSTPPPPTDAVASASNVAGGSAHHAAAGLPHARSPGGVKYVTYQLTSDTPLLGQECAICFEDFEPGQRVARLNCLCTYHLWCISEWLQRTPACPVHYE